MKVAATLRVNGTDYPVELDPHVSLLKAVREELGLTGSKEGCDDSECGACMMLLDGEPVNACSYLALQAEGREVTTVEGLAGDEEVGPLQRAFLQQAGVQCGFCTRACWYPGPRCFVTTPLPPRRRSGSACPGTSAGARDTGGSSEPFGRSLRGTSHRSGARRSIRTRRPRTTPADAEGLSGASGPPAKLPVCCGSGSPPPMRYRAPGSMRWSGRSSMPKGRWLRRSLVARPRRRSPALSL